jgi:hypothetical protein
MKGARDYPESGIGMAARFLSLAPFEISYACRAASACAQLWADGLLASARALKYHFGRY